jgi:hypothetical protein
MDQTNGVNIYTIYSVIPFIFLFHSHGFMNASLEIKLEATYYSLSTLTWRPILAKPHPV